MGPGADIPRYAFQTHALAQINKLKEVLDNPNRLSNTNLSKSDEVKKIAGIIINFICALRRIDGNAADEMERKLEAVLPNPCTQLKAIIRQTISEYKKLLANSYNPYDSLDLLSFQENQSRFSTDIRYMMYYLYSIDRATAEDMQREVESVLGSYRQETQDTQSTITQRVAMATSLTTSHNHKI